MEVGPEVLEKRKERSDDGILCSELMGKMALSEMFRVWKKGWSRKYNARTVTKIMKDWRREEAVSKSVY